MTIVKRACLMAGASVVALGLLAPGGAQAFNTVNWQWHALVLELILKKVTIDVDFDPDGIVMVEAFQLQVGDVTATSIVHGIHNDPPADGIEFETQTHEIDLGRVDMTSHGVANINVTWDNSGGLVDENGDPLVGSCQVLAINGACGFDLGTAVIEIEVPVAVAGALDAELELPEVISTATAVGNNLSIDSATMVEFHVGQKFFGDATATSVVWDITNATVDSSATAVGNNFSVNVDPCGGCPEGEGDNLIVIGDLSQVHFGASTAFSYVTDVSISNYNNLVAIDRPIVSSVATAVGNNASISVGVGN